jgi:hypothetical protein
VGDVRPLRESGGECTMPWLPPLAHTLQSSRTNGTANERTRGVSRIGDGVRRADGAAWCTVCGSAQVELQGALAGLPDTTTVAQSALFARRREAKAVVTGCTVDPRVRRLQSAGASAEQAKGDAAVLESFLAHFELGGGAAGGDSAGGAWTSAGLRVRLVELIEREVDAAMSSGY